VSVCGRVGVFVNMITLEPFEIYTPLFHQKYGSTKIQQNNIIMKFLWERDMVKSSDEFENSCIRMHCCARVHGDLTPLVF